jgi:hypothetical protein
MLMELIGDILPAGEAAHENAQDTDNFLVTVVLTG